ncbi:vancomycin high temperature exclusion protein [Mesonia sp. K4-1]|uniref:SanA/YdcF family protein n=1 Tax=Mesonia sp. K4-1 TaxID=2602760 RepID=UPI0011C8AAFB|nr:ElyC/SanA/YdcF family protein [Mesonia sp. K4-1]TXK80087.1 vancomycin high temperature exclusion protein [Mesonia sp. K4-1]
MLKKLKFTFISFIVLSLTLIFISNYIIVGAAKNKTFSTLSEIPKNKVGLVLGTSKYLRDGRVNLYFTYRINATVQLFKSGKIDFVLISGDNGSVNYDEPNDFKNELLKKGIPEDKIFLDYAGFRTLDSVVRAKEIFGQNSVTIISQEFHNERAIYLASKHALSAVGYNAKDVSLNYGFKTQLREYLARTKAFLDIMIGIEPKFLGDKIEIK